MNGLSGVPERDLSCWKSNILWSLKQYHNVEKPLVLWDILAALLAFKEIAPSFVEDLLLEWLSSWNLDLSSDMSTEKILFHVQSSLPKVSMRQIHLLNMICRRLVLPEMKTVAPKDGTIYCSEDKRNLWNDLLIQSEKELRVRLVTFSFRAILFLSSHLAVAASSSTNWLPVGVTQMKQWVAINRMLVEDQILLLASRINELGSRIKSICENEVEESCGFCSASVPFESPEVAFCKSAMSADHSVRHKLGRCAVSMKLCPVTNLLWFCMCCQRWTTKHMPSAFFSMYDSSTDVGYAIESLSSFDCMKPLCPFCGILLQRYAPNFLLSANPV
uniref:Mediator of RNA polymerase II transcription subunit 12 n=1 Tax=Anthurium amnicola TaxID=1678845 RepID=A0A1D1ZH90_9ARAE